MLFFPIIVPFHLSFPATLVTTLQFDSDDVEGFLVLEEHGVPRLPLFHILHDYN